jgi:2,5-diketo-D-gluconate reductase A
MDAMTETPEVDLGKGIAMPMVGFGTWRLHGDQAYNAIRYALRTGYRHIDTATMYENEAEVGRAITDSGLDRRDIFVTTKLPPGRAAHARATIADSLRALNTGYVDLWLVHWPPRRNVSPRLWQEFLEIRDEGLCRAVGVSNYDIAQIDELIAATGERPAVNQINWSPDLYDKTLLAAHTERGIAVEGYSSLKGTQLSNPVLAEIAAKYAITPAHVILRWQLELGITVIPKSARPERIDANFDLFSFSLTPEEVDRVNHL